MLRTFCRVKIMNAVISNKKLRYNGSIGIDKDIMKAADLMAGEQVQVLNVNNGERITTYVIEEEAGSGGIVLYGPAARRGEIDDELVILSYCLLEAKESHNFKMRIVRLLENNQCKEK